MTESTFMVLADISLSEDGGHLSIKHTQLWVDAVNKQSAAGIASLYLRDRYKEQLVSDKIIKVISEEDWGVKYFIKISERSLNG